MPETRILVVDDEKEIADLIEIYLVSDGYKVLKANNAEEGLEILGKEEEVHLVLLDIMMPGMNGLEMCKKIRETNNIPIIMLSAKSTDLDKILGLGTGADDYVTKPFNPLELTARVKSQLRRYTQLNPNSSVHDAGKNEISIKGLTINKDNHNNKHCKYNPNTCCCNKQTFTYCIMKISAVIYSLSCGSSIYISLCKLYICIFSHSKLL